MTPYQRGRPNAIRSNPDVDLPSFSDCQQQRVAALDVARNLQAFDLHSRMRFHQSASCSDVALVYVNPRASPGERSNLWSSASRESQPSYWPEPVSGTPGHSDSMAKLLGIPPG